MHILQRGELSVIFFQESKILDLKFPENFDIFTSGL
jgi:hypothetical protein